MATQFPPVCIYLIAKTLLYTYSTSYIWLLEADRLEGHLSSDPEQQPVIGCARCQDLLAWDDLFLQEQHLEIVLGFEQVPYRLGQLFIKHQLITFNLPDFDSAVQGGTKH